ncbi:MAG: glutamate--tRNA ligase, partial [bacterium]|nr:glutamate--tRNA ligase [bacterium]
MIITRFPPSPTGYLHIGRARTALFNYLFARKQGGKMVFRIEDTDKERSKKEYEENIIECLKWLNIGYDSGPFRQSERNEIYSKYIQKLIDDGFAYVSKEDTSATPEGETKRAEVIRFKNPKKKIIFTDLIRGEIEFDTTDLGDFVIAKSIDEPLYHLTVVVDDHEMEITHVIRGDDGISNTPRQILIQEGIGAKRPLYAHVPLILAADKSKLSGRHGAVAVSEYRNEGYLPEAIINFLALLGWNPGTDQELFTVEELIQQFDLEKVQKSGAIFNIEKLKWFNRQY